MVVATLCSLRDPLTSHIYCNTYLQMAPTRKNAVHRYFTYDERSGINTCQLCNNKLKGKHATNLKNHIAAKHSGEYQVLATLSEEASHSSKTNETAMMGKMEKLIKNCVRLVTVHGRPIAMMEDEAFQDIINIAASSGDGCKHTNVKAIKTRITQEADAIRNKISNDVKHQMINIKLDAATCLERKFVGVNIQYIKESKIVVRNLAVLEVNSPQTAPFLKSVLEDILTGFKITTDQIYSICTDNGTNMKKMVKLMGGVYDSEIETRQIACTETGETNGAYTDEEDDASDDESTENANTMEIGDFEEFFSAMELDIGTFLHTDGIFKIRGMLCAAHTLQLAVKDALKDDSGAQEIIDVAKDIVNILRKPNNINRIRQENRKKPIKDCATRWTATYSMLVRLQELQDFCNTVPELKAPEAFWSDLATVISCLRPLSEATVTLQREQLTIGDFFITWLDCKNKVGAIPYSFATSLNTAMEKRQTKLLQNDVVLEALYLDGRLNIVLSAEECQKARALLSDVYKNVEKIREQEAEEIELVSLINDVPQASTSRDLSAVEQMLSNTERARGNTRKKRSFDLCLFEIITAPRMELSQNIIQHWTNKAVGSSEIAEVAKIVMAAPATQVSVERLFSSLKFILHPLRSNMSSTLLKNSMLVRANKDLY